MSQPDYRWIGPVLDCPVCGCNVFQTVVVMDPDTQLPGMYGLDAECLGCDGRVKLATPLDQLLIEPRVEVPDDTD